MSLVNIDFPNCQLNVQENSGNNSVSIIGSGIGVSNVSGNIVTNVNSDQVYITNGSDGATNTMSYNSLVIDDPTNSFITNVNSSSISLTDNESGASNTVSIATSVIHNGGTNSTTMTSSGFRCSTDNENTFAEIGLGTIFQDAITLSRTEISAPNGITNQTSNLTAVEYETRLTSQLLQLNHATTGLIQNDIRPEKISMYDTTQTNQSIILDNTTTTPFIKVSYDADEIRIERSNIFIGTATTSSYGTAGQVIGKTSANVLNWIDQPQTLSQVVVIDLQTNYTINPSTFTSANYSLWAKTSAAGQQTIFLPTALTSVGQIITIRSEADSTSINSGSGNLIYRGTTAAISTVISQASCVQFTLGSITSGVYNWFVVSTS